jgi:hypothetical protein
MFRLHYAYAVHRLLYGLISDANHGESAAASDTPSIQPSASTGCRAPRIRLSRRKAGRGTEARGPPISVSTLTLIPRECGDNSRLRFFGINPFHGVPLAPLTAARAARTGRQYGVTGTRPRLTKMVRMANGRASAVPKRMAVANDDQAHPSRAPRNDPVRLSTNFNPPSSIRP